MRLFFGPYIISFIWMAPFFVLSYLAGKIYNQRRLEDSLSPDFKINMINLIIVIIIAVRNLTLIAFHRHGNIAIQNSLLPFILLLFLLIIITAIGALRENIIDIYQINKTRKIVVIAIISVFITFLFMGYAKILGKQIGFVVNSIDGFFFNTGSGTASNKEPKTLKDKLKTYPLLTNNYIPEIDNFITYVVNHPTANSTVIWYRPINPNLSEQTRGVTVLITKLNSIQKAKERLKLRKNDHPLDSSLIIISRKEMYKGYNRGQGGGGPNKDYKTCLIAWSQNNFTFEIYSTMNNLKEIDKDLLLDQAKQVTSAIYSQTQDKF